MANRGRRTQITLLTVTIVVGILLVEFFSQTDNGGHDEQQSQPQEEAAAATQYDEPLVSEVDVRAVEKQRNKAAVVEEQPCFPLQEIDHEMLAHMHRAVSLPQDGAAGGSSSSCVHAIEPLIPWMPFRSIGGANLCRLNAPRFNTVQQFLENYDWAEVQQRMTSAKMLIANCPPKNTHHYVYLDVGSQTLSTTGIEWFRRNYPRSNEFLLHAFDWDPAFDPAKKDPAVYDSVMFHRAQVWNESGYVTIFRDRVPDDPPPSENDPDVDANQLAEQRLRYYLQEMISRQPVPKFFHRSENFVITEAMNIPEVDEPRLVTVKAVSLAETLMLNVEVSDFVVLRLDADGSEWMLIDHLITTGALKFLDEVMLVCHNNEIDPLWPKDVTLDDCHRLLNTLRAGGVYVHEWYR